MRAATTPAQGPEESLMQTVLPAEFKRGMLLMLDNAPHFLEDFHASGTAQTKHKLHVRLRNLQTSRIVDRTFADNERVAVAQLDHRTVQYSYKQGDTYSFLDTQSFEELNLSAAQVGERRWFLKENEEYRRCSWRGSCWTLSCHRKSRCKWWILHHRFAVVPTPPGRPPGSDRPGGDGAAYSSPKAK